MRRRYRGRAHPLQCFTTRQTDRPAVPGLTESIHSCSPFSANFAISSTALGKVAENNAPDHRKPCHEGVHGNSNNDKKRGASVPALDTWGGLAADPLEPHVCDSAPPPTQAGNSAIATSSPPRSSQLLHPTSQPPSLQGDGSLTQTPAHVDSPATDNMCHPLKTCCGPRRELRTQAAADGARSLVRRSSVMTYRQEMHTVKNSGRMDDLRCSTAMRHHPPVLLYPSFSALFCPVQVWTSPTQQPPNRGCGR